MVLEDIDNRQNQILLRDHDMQVCSYIKLTIYK